MVRVQNSAKIWRKIFDEVCLLVGVTCWLNSCPFWAESRGHHSANKRCEMKTQPCVCTAKTL